MTDETSAALHAPDTLWVSLIETAVDCINAAIGQTEGHSAPAEESSQQAWDWLAKHRNLELSYGYGEDEEDTDGWLVHRVRGNVNDREWEQIGAGLTPLAALEAARQFLAPAEARSEQAGGAS